MGEFDGGPGGSEAGLLAKGTELLGELLYVRYIGVWDGRVLGAKQSDFILQAEQRGRIDVEIIADSRGLRGGVKLAKGFVEKIGHVNGLIVFILDEVEGIGEVLLRLVGIEVLDHACDALVGVAVFDGEQGAAVLELGGNGGLLVFIGEFKGLAQVVLSVLKALLVEGDLSVFEQGLDGRHVVIQGDQTGGELMDMEDEPSGGEQQAGEPAGG